MPAKNASLLRRLGAMFYDGILILAIMFIGTLPFVAIGGGESVDPRDPMHTAYQLVLVTIVYVFFVGFWAAYGRTLGMQSWGLRIETPHGTRPGFAQCSMRFFASLLSWLPAGLGFWWQIIDTEGLSWHDRLSGTRLRFYPRP